MLRRVLPVLVLLLSVAVAGLSAHLKVEKTYPAADATVTVAPDRIQVWYSQNPTLAVSALALEGPSGTVELGKLAAGSVDGKPDRSLVAAVVGRLTPGKYTASWKTSGNDGHIQTDTFEFTYTPASQR
jgi:methionine-rich copper-binding protein CopC